MPIRTPPRTPAPPRTEAQARPRPIAAAALFAVAEFGLALTIGGFFALGRAEALVFLAFRPWLLLLLAGAIARRSWRERASAYALALLLAAAGETGFLLALGATNPWPEALRGLLAGAPLALLLDLLVQLGARRHRAAGLALGAALLLIPGGLFFHDRILFDPPREVRAPKPELMLMTGLPIVWGEGGAFDPKSEPSESYRALQREFEIRPLDALTEASLTGRLLLLAQPRALAPEELVALDAWVRRGGRALILADPKLDWPSELPLGDVRRPPPVSLLEPLLSHWKVGLEPPLRDGTGGAVLFTSYALPEPGWRLAVTRPGRFVAPDCRALLPSAVVRCGVGKGEAMLVADADLLHDELWAPSGPARHLRVADNPLIVAEWLDRLAGLRRDRVDGRVEWLDSEASRARALAVGALPAGLALLIAGGLARRRRG